MSSGADVGMRCKWMAVQIAMAVGQVKLHPQPVPQVSQVGRWVEVMVVKESKCRLLYF